eukprot:5140339-Pyramimonas_sp.AAC.1
MQQQLGHLAPFGKATTVALVARGDCPRSGGRSHTTSTSESSSLVGPITEINTLPMQCPPLFLCRNLYSVACQGGRMCGRHWVLSFPAPGSGRGPETCCVRWPWRWTRPGPRTASS